MQPIEKQKNYCLENTQKFKKEMHFELHLNKLSISSKFRICQFPKDKSIEWSYLCHKHEQCCYNGCCVSSLKRLTEFWYIWILVILFCVISLLCNYYYKRLKRHHLRSNLRGRENPLVQLHQLQRLDLDAEREIHDLLLQRISASQQIQNFINAPPAYSTLMPLQVQEQRKAEDSPLAEDEEEPPPRYSVACRLMERGQVAETAI